MCSSSSFVQRFKSGRGSSSQSIMQSREPRPSAAGPPLRLSSGWDVLSVLESRVSSSHLNQKHYTESMTCTESGASDGFTMIRGPNTDLWLELWESKKDWMIFYFFYKETSVREASGRGGIPQVSPLLERDLQVDWQQLQRELWEGLSRSSQLRKRQDQNVSFWRCSTETLKQVSSFTSRFVLHSCRPSCPRQDPQDPRQSDYNECTPEKGKIHISSCYEENLTRRGVI